MHGMRVSGPTVMVKQDLWGCDSMIQMLTDKEFWEFVFIPVFMVGIFPWLAGIWWWLEIFDFPKEKNK